jgi:hypothetical protein
MAKVNHKWPRSYGLFLTEFVFFQVLISSNSELAFIKDAYNSAVTSYLDSNNWMSQGTVRRFYFPIHHPFTLFIQMKETYKAMMQIESSIVRSTCFFWVFHYPHSVLYLAWQV